MRKFILLLIIPLLIGASGCAYNPKYAKQIKLTKPRVYVVKRGDTLFDIARKYGVSVGSIKRENRLKSSTIKPGQRMTIPSKRSSNRRDAKTRKVKKKTPQVKSGKSIPPIKAPKIKVRLSWPIKDKMTITSNFGVRKILSV